MTPAPNYGPYLNRLLLLVAIIFFVLAAFHGHLGNLTELDEGMIGLAFFAAAGLV